MGLLNTQNETKFQSSKRNVWPNGKCLRLRGGEQFREERQTAENTRE